MTSCGNCSPTRALRTLRTILLRAFKKEAQLEFWVEGSPGKPYLRLKSYSICATSGVLEPKRRFGDEQVPQGFYELDWFNPQSNFYLSLHVSYPHEFDRTLADESGRRYFSAWRLRNDWLPADYRRRNQRGLLASSACAHSGSNASAHRDFSS